jgi:hypothetical protein
MTAPWSVAHPLAWAVPTSRVDVLRRQLIGRFSDVHRWPVLGVHRGRDLPVAPLALERQSQNFSNLPHRMALHGALRPPLGRPERSSEPSTPSPTDHAARPARGAPPGYPTPVLKCAGIRAQVCRNACSSVPE